MVDGGLGTNLNGDSPTILTYVIDESWTQKTYMEMEGCDTSD